MIQLRFLLVLCLILLTSCSKPDYTDHRGKTGHFEDFNGRWLVINYWASWCKPCIKEIPELNQLAEKHQSILTVIGVDFDQNQGEELQQAIQKLGIKFSVLTTDPAVKLNYEKPTVLPTTYIFSPTGKLHKRLLGPQTEHDIMQHLEI